MATMMQIGPKAGLPALPVNHHPQHPQHHHHHHHHRRSDHLITTRRRNEAARLKMQQQTAYYAQTAQASHFETHTSEQITRNKIQRRFAQLKIDDDADLERRREALRQQLASDEARFRAELARAEPTQEARIEAMRTRVGELRARREVERKAVVEEKLLQRWRNECDELRAVESNILTKDVADARAGQLIEQQEKRELASQEKRYYDHLWEQDRLRKIEREDADRDRRKALNEATSATLREQLHMLRMKAQEEERLKNEEAALMRQDLELQKIAEERAHEQKLASQRLIRLDLDAFNKAKVLARAREVQDALELDLSVVNAFFRMDEQEKQSNSRRKEELKREMRMYMDHLREQQRVEKQRAEELEVLHAAESQKLWQARAEKWQREQRARDRLMQEVIAGRKEQVEHALIQNRVQQHEAEQEKLALEAQIAQTHAQEEIDRAAHLKSAVDYRAALVEQVKVAHDRKEAEARREAEMGLAAREEEAKYAALLAHEVQNAHKLPRVRAFRAANRDPPAATIMPLEATVVGWGLQRAAAEARLAAAAAEAAAARAGARRGS
ncbi:tumor suppressor, Mitostatin-domain-containing protein [Geranomyces variabilis]|nr:tumor suppressor, Mitostatin-domain-containing protein [Geranomyces variabilis]KAJ3135131.1 Cilia- and flagella-associated protein 53 [Geranomyces variabilis]